TALLGTVEVHEMQILRPLVNPPTCHGGGVITENRFLGVIALPKADTLPAAKIDGRIDEHAEIPSCTCERRAAKCAPSARLSGSSVLNPHTFGGQNQPPLDETPRATLYRAKPRSKPLRRNAEELHQNTR